MQREKQELIPTLKIRVEDDEELSEALTEEMQVSILEVKDIETKHGKKTLAVVEAENKKYQLFLNSASISNLIDSFGNDDANWIGKICNLRVENAPAPYNKQKMIVVYPLEAEKNE